MVGGALRNGGHRSIVGEFYSRHRGGVGFRDVVGGFDLDAGFVQTFPEGTDTDSVVDAPSDDKADPEKGKEPGGQRDQVQHHSSP